MDQFTPIGKNTLVSAGVMVSASVKTEVQKYTSKMQNEPRSYILSASSGRKSKSDLIWDLHRLNMPHDDDQKCKEYQRWVIEYCQYRYPQHHNSLRNHQNNQSSTSTINHDQHHPNSSSNTTTFVMSRTLDHNSNPWEWSQCSRHYVTTFLEWVGFLLINIKIIYVCGFSICLLNWTWVEWSFTFLLES